MLEKHKEVLKSEEILRLYKSGDRKIWSDEFIEDREFRLGEQFDEVVKSEYENKGLMAAAINETLPATDQVIADLTSNNPRFDAVAIEDSDVKIASYVARLYDWIFYNSKGQVKTERAIRDFCEGGVGVFFTYPDYSGDPELKIKDIDPLKVYIDPSSSEPDSSDSSHIIISDIFSEEKILNNYEIDLTDVESESSNEYSRQRAETQGQIIFSNRLHNTKYYRIIERFTKIKVKRPQVIYKDFERIFESEEEYKKWSKEPAIILIGLGSESYVIDDVERYLDILNTMGDVYHLIRDNYNNIQIVPGIEEPSPFVIPNSTTQIKQVTNEYLVNEGRIEYNLLKQDRILRILSIGGKLLANEVLPISNYPVVTTMLHHNRTPYATGDIRLIKPLQEELNILDSRIQAYLQMITTLRGFVQKGGTLKKKVDQDGSPLGMIIYEVDMDVDNGIIFPQYPPFPAGIMQQRENIIRQIQRIIGAYSFQDGEMTQTPRTASGTSQIDEFMRRRAAYKKRKIEASLEQLGKVMAEYIPHIYTERKIIRLILPNHRTPNETIINDQKEIDGQIKHINNVRDLKFDVRIVSGSTLPSNRVNERAELLRAYELNMLKNPKWWILKSDFEDVDEILEEENLIPELQAQIQSLQEQVKKLEGSLQRKVNENIQLSERVEVFKTKSYLKGMESELKHATLHTKERLKDLEKEEKNNGRNYPNKSK